MEFHPRLDINNLLVEEKKIILGSFPVWSQTLSIPVTLIEEIEKKNERINKREMEFFFGSSKNNFWKWYKSFVDAEVQIDSIEDIKKSLAANEIGITDLIIQCKRKGKSALDKHLTNKKYNYKFFEYPKKDETIKILCTSKGLMNNMLLTKSFFRLHPSLKIDESLSKVLQEKLFSEIPDGAYDLIQNPFFYKISCDKGGTLECFAIPSPGSPYRKLTDFGFKGEDNNRFLNEFLSVAFNWFS